MTNTTWKITMLLMEKLTSFRLGHGFKFAKCSKLLDAKDSSTRGIASASCYMFLPPEERLAAGVNRSCRASWLSPKRRNPKRPSTRGTKLCRHRVHGDVGLRWVCNGLFNYMILYVCILHISGLIMTASLWPHHRWWLVRGIIPKWPQFKLVKYSHLHR